MSKIIQLSEQMTNRIAAGEVVERPVGVLKELVENAIDANATSIIVEYEQGGLSLLKVSDNGEGMDKDDLSLAFKRHSTSKIKELSDLNAIHSLGFRGEALPSIASVARVSLTSHHDGQAYQIVLDNGKEVSFNQVSHPQGTTIIVSELFYKIPARLKYLKTPQYEATRINALMNNFALGYPHISFKVKNENREILQTRGNNDLKAVLFSIYGVEVANLLKGFSGKSSNFEIEVVYVLPHLHRAQKYHQYFYLNNRMIQYFGLAQQINELFHRYMPSDRYPIFVMKIESDAQLVDVNVHPSKWQVKVSQEKELFELVESLFQQSLIEEMKPKAIKEKVVTPMKPMFEKLDLDQVQIPISIPTIVEEPSFETDIEPIEINEVPIKQPVKKLNVIAQHHGKYILAEDEQGLYLFDQHASMERVQYEKFQKQIRERKFVQQPLLLPIIIKQMKPLLDDFEKTQEKLSEFGIEVDSFSDQDIIVRSVPLWLGKVDPHNYVIGLFDSIAQDDKYDILKVNDHKIATMACKSSIRFNERRSLSELQRIVDDLMLCDQPYHCPHGRPTFITIDAASLLKEFSR